MWPLYRPHTHNWESLATNCQSKSLAESTAPNTLQHPPGQEPVGGCCSLLKNGHSHAVVHAEAPERNCAAQAWTPCRLKPPRTLPRRSSGGLANWGSFGGLRGRFQTDDSEDVPIVAIASSGMARNGSSTTSERTPESTKPVRRPPWRRRWTMTISNLQPTSFGNGVESLAPFGITWTSPTHVYE